MQTATKASVNSRIDEQDWIEAALDMLARGGLGAVRIEPLALRLGVTKGAFYARYPTRDALLVAMLDYWRRVSTVDVLTGFAAMDEAADERLERIVKLSSRRSDVRNRGLLEMGIRIWADSDARAAVTMKEIDAYRLDYFRSVLRSNGFSGQDAEARAVLIYGYLIADACLSGVRSEDTKRSIRALLTNGVIDADAGGEQH
ncbi:MAG TPA: TetR/AcrR family transcriptional regulator [Sphingomicrobium sp.]|nr:TetR/AcrR family transcriptional regulator [Sphingomicrobium sp.]